MKRLKIITSLIIMFLIIFTTVISRAEDVNCKFVNLQAGMYNNLICSLGAPTTGGRYLYNIRPYNNNYVGERTDDIEPIYYCANKDLEIATNGGNESDSYDNKVFCSYGTIEGWHYILENYITIDKREALYKAMPYFFEPDKDDSTSVDDEAVNFINTVIVPAMLDSDGIEECEDDYPTADELIAVQQAWIWTITNPDDNSNSDILNTFRSGSSTSSLVSLTSNNVKRTIISTFLDVLTNASSAEGLSVPDLSIGTQINETSDNLKYNLGPIKVNNLSEVIDIKDISIQVKKKTDNTDFTDYILVDESGSVINKNSNTDIENALKQGKQIYVQVEKSKVQNLKITSESKYENNDYYIYFNSTNTNQQPIISPYMKYTTSTRTQNFYFGEYKFYISKQDEDNNSLTGAIVNLTVKKGTDTVSNNNYTINNNKQLVYTKEFATASLSSFSETYTFSISEIQAPTDYMATSEILEGTLNVSFNTSNGYSFTRQITSGSLSSFAYNDNGNVETHATISNKQIAKKTIKILKTNKETNEPIANIGFTIGGNRYVTGNDGTITLDEIDVTTDRTVSLVIKEDDTTTYVGLPQMTVNLKFENESLNIDQSTVVSATGGSLEDDVSLSEDGGYVVITLKNELAEDAVLDLALRKYITSVNDLAITDRNPNLNNRIDTTPLDGTQTTAIYKHKKDPVSVGTGDLVDYTITIYNEGEINGRATQIVDVLPEGIEYVQVVSGDYTGSYDLPTNVLTLTKIGNTNISAYDGNTLSYESVVIRCEVKASNNEVGKVFTNVAYISKERKEGSATDIINQEPTEGGDRDSKPGVVPSGISQDELEDYTGIDTTLTNDDLANTNKYYAGFQDDDDFEKLILEPPFDLKLIKRIVEVDGKTVEDRINSIDESKLNRTGFVDTTAKYSLNKTPYPVYRGSIVKYTIRVYNEGYVDGYASKITDDIPSGLEFLTMKLGDTEESLLEEGVSQEEIDAMKYNQENLWQLEADGTHVSTTKLAKDVREENLIKAFEQQDGTKEFTQDNYKEVSIYFKVKQDAPLKTNIINEAQITECTDEDGNIIKDRDSQTDLFKPEGNYQDDEDFDVIRLTYFDMALRKFIVAITTSNELRPEDKLVDENGKYLREPVVDTSTLDNGEENSTKTAIYNHTKVPVITSVGENVIYCLRVYNESELPGYAAEITDYLPVGLEFVDNEFNRQQGWTKVSDRIYKTTILKDKLLEGRTEDASGEITLGQAEDVLIMCKVVGESPYSNILTNIAEITKYEDQLHYPIKDRDSYEDDLDYPIDEQLPTYKDGTDDYIPGQEDDDDFEKVIAYKFDLALRKWVTDSIVTQNGQTNTYPTGNKPYDEPEAPAKVELKKDKLDTTSVKWNFKIRVTNQGNLAGYATQVSDYIPEGLKFVKEDNPKWEQLDDNTVVTSQLSEVLLEPGEYADIDLVLTWINGANNLNTKTNWAEISEDKNKYDIPDIDSIPGNKVEGEDDIDYAPVLITIATGQVRIFYGILFVLIPLAIILSALIVRNNKKKDRYNI